MLAVLPRMNPDTEPVSHSQGVITMVATKTATKPVAKKPVAKKVAAVKPAVKPVAAAQAFVAEAVETVTGQADVAANFARDFARDFALTSIGMPFVVQKQIRQFPAVNLDSVNLDSVKAMLNDAKLTGAVRVAKFQGRIQPYTEKIEARLPDQFVKVIETGRQRVRDLIAA